MDRRLTCGGRGAGYRRLWQDPPPHVPLVAATHLRGRSWNAGNVFLFGFDGLIICIGSKGIRPKNRDLELDFQSKWEPNWFPHNAFETTPEIAICPKRRRTRPQPPRDPLLSPRE